MNWHAIVRMGELNLIDLGPDVQGPWGGFIETMQHVAAMKDVEGPGSYATEVYLVGPGGSCVYAFGGGAKVAMHQLDDYKASSTEGIPSDVLDAIVEAATCDSKSGKAA